MALGGDVELYVTVAFSVLESAVGSRAIYLSP